ncbi:hypothetical protein Tco_1077251 [Tanacetum coccineum]
MRSNEIALSSPVILVSVFVVCLFPFMMWIFDLEPFVIVFDIRLYIRESLNLSYWNGIPPPPYNLQVYVSDNQQIWMRVSLSLRCRSLPSRSLNTGATTKHTTLKNCLVKLYSFDSAVHRVHAVSFAAAVASKVSAACWFYAAAAYFVSAAPQSSCFAKIYLETWN